MIINEIGLVFGGGLVGVLLGGGWANGWVWERGRGCRGGGVSAHVNQKRP